MKEVVRLDGIWAGYDGIVVLENISLSIKEQDFLGIIGPNGGGKTTLLKVILGLVKPVKGNVRIMGELPDRQKKFIGYVPQANSFDREFPISVWDVVLMGRIYQAPQIGPIRYFSQEDKNIAREALEALSVIDLKDKQIGKLSEGQRQRVFIARALTTKPKILLLDEPTSSVDTCIQAGIYDLLNKLKEKTAIVLVSHDIGVISRHVDKIACLNRKLYYHDAKEISMEELEVVYGCPVDMIAHGTPHRVMQEHKEE